MSRFKRKQFQFVVYKISNNVNGKVYIGITNNFKSRIARHFYDMNHECQTVLYRAMRKYGKKNFSFDILDNADTWKKVCELEKHYIKILNTRIPSGMNMTDGGDGVLGLEFDKETIEKMKIRNKGKGNPFSKLTDKDVLDIRNRYFNNNVYQFELANEYNITQENISLIIRGKGWAHIGGICLEEGFTNKGKLNKEQVISIRKKYKNEKISQKALGDIYGVSKTAIQNIIHRKAYSYI